MSNASIIRHSTAPTGDHQHANDVDEQHSQALFLRTTSPNSVLVAEPSDAASRSASSASSAAVVASSPPAAVPEVLSPASISAAPVMLPAFSWPRSPAQARQHATDLLQQHRREWSKPGWALFVRQVLMGLLSSNTPDLDALDTQLQSNEQTRCWLEQPFLRLLYEVTKAVMRVLNSNPVYPNTLAFPEQEVQQMVDSMLLVSYIASVDPTSSDEINGLRDYLLVPSRAILVQRCVAQLGPALRDEVRRSYPDLAQYVDLAIGQPVLTVGLFGPMVLPALVEALTADMQTSLPELAEMASNCAMVMRLVQRDLQLDMKRYAEARRVLALPEQGGGNEAVDDDADELVAVLKGTINAHQPQFGPARAPVRHVSENLSVSYVMCHAPLPTIPHELAEVDLRAESVVSVHVLQSATIDDEKAMQRMEGALKPLERHNQRWFNNNLALLPFTHVSLLCTGEFGNRLLVHKLRWGVEYVLVPLAFGEELWVEDVRKMAKLDGTVSVQAYHTRVGARQPFDVECVTGAEDNLLAALPAVATSQYAADVSLFDVLAYCGTQGPFAAQDVCIHFARTTLHALFALPMPALKAAG